MHVSGKVLFFQKTVLIYYPIPVLSKKYGTIREYQHMSLLFLFLPPLDFSENSGQIFLFLYTTEKKKKKKKERNLLSEISVW